ncbi:pentapeptide repeat-containing protein [Citrobacter braakii]|uniref:pentapeptide repeat-containing protein n=1 Tax=Citrobacter braakii TaxID=57706 RepID=UPI001561701D|nr:pentapeptide repeat-containing protein [Citrobacter braakii]NRF74078.1 pentapeptide repeat-containing protein [Citrobacter braakii]
MEDSKYFNKEQYHLLLKCAELNDFTEWNDYIANLVGAIRLVGANFDGVNLTDAVFYRPDGIGVNLSEATFRGSKLTRVDFSDCNLLNTNFEDAKITNSFFNNAHLNRSKFQGAVFTMVHFSGTDLTQANLKNTELFFCHFHEAKFYHAELSGAKFLGGGNNPLVGKEQRMNLCGTIFQHAKFDNETYFDFFYVSRETDFRTTSFEAANYSPGLRQTLRYCNRRHSWKDWYGKQNRVLAYVAKIFWGYSDYGRSLKQTILSIFKVNLIFSMIYFFFPSLIHGLNGHDFIGSIYFSFVTMTTLGFGDMYAADSSIARCIVVIQVLYGYVLLGALITVLSTLFTSDGPAQGLIKHPKHAPIKITFT